MSTEEQAVGTCGASEPATTNLGELIPIAMVIAAGCEPCAERMVERALAQGVPRALIRQALGVVAGMRAADCFADAVGAEAVARMEKPLLAARRALQDSQTSGGDRSCCA